MERLELAPEALDSPLALELMAGQQAEVAARYGRGGSGAAPRPEEFEPPAGTFLVARAGGEPVGCGGLCALAPGVGEIRRMYVLPTARGQGVGRRILAALEAAAREAGYRRVRLETGFRQVEAIGLYGAAGYRRVPCYGRYASDPISVCFEKAL